LGKSASGGTIFFPPAGIMGIYTERKNGIWSCAAVLTAVFAVFYGVWLFVGPELLRSETAYAAAAAEFSPKNPLHITIHGWATPECMPLLPAVARLLRDISGAPMESVLRGVSILMLGAGALLVFLAAGSRHTPRAGVVAAAMYSTCFLSLGTAIEGTPATANAFLLSSAQIVFFYYSVRRSDWNRAWIFSTLLVMLGFLAGGVMVLLLFVLPMFFFRRPLSVAGKFRRPGFAVAVAVAVLVALLWSGVYTSSSRQDSLYDMWWRHLTEVSLGWQMLSFPFALVFWLLPWSLIAWMPFCEALQPLDKTPIYSRYLRTLIFPALVFLWLLPETGRFGLFYVLAPLSILTGRFYEMGVRRYGIKLRRFFVTVEIFMAVVPLLIAAGCFLPGSLLEKFISVDQTLNFRLSPHFRMAALAIMVSALLLAFYVHWGRRREPVWMIILAASLASALFFNGFLFPYKSQEHSKRKLGGDVRAALGASDRVIYTRNVRNLTGGLFYSKVRIYRLGATDELPEGEEEIYLLGGENYPQFPGDSRYIWENKLPENYVYNGHPLKLWKGRPSRAYAAPADAPGGISKSDNPKNIKTED
jgi:hypothetical protein